MDELRIMAPSFDDLPKEVKRLIRYAMKHKWTPEKLCQKLRKYGYECEVFKDVPHD